METGFVSERENVPPLAVEPGPVWCSRNGGFCCFDSSGFWLLWFLEFEVRPQQHDSSLQVSNLRTVSNVRPFDLLNRIPQTINEFWEITNTNQVQPRCEMAKNAMRHRWPLVAAIRHLHSGIFRWSSQPVYRLHNARISQRRERRATHPPVWNWAVLMFRNRV